MKALKIVLCVFCSIASSFESAWSFVRYPDTWWALSAGMCGMILAFVFGMMAIKEAGRE